MASFAVAYDALIHMLRPY